MAEGFLEITTLRIYNDTTGMMYEFAPGGPFGDWVPFNPESSQGDSMRIYVEVTNNGADDDCRIEFTGNIAVWDNYFFLGAGLTYYYNFPFTMPNHDVTLTVNVSHFEGVVGWVWDTSSVWELLFPFMNIHASPYKQ